jgi:hypothetical protein
MARNGFKSPPSFHNNFDIINTTFLAIFFLFFPFNWLKDVMLVQTNKMLKKSFLLGSWSAILDCNLEWHLLAVAFPLTTFGTPSHLMK